MDCSRIHASQKPKFLNEVKLIISPYALESNYPNASKEFSWRYVFLEKGLIFDKDRKLKWKYYIHESLMRKGARSAIQKAEINKLASVYTFRYRFAKYLSEAVEDIHYIQELLGHRSSKKKEIYTHVSRQRLSDIQNPIDSM